MKHSETDKDDLETSLINVLIGDNFKEIIVEASEVTLDSFLSDGVLKEIPFLGVLYKSIKAAKGLREAIFAKKVYKFLSELKSISQEQREEFIFKLEDNKEYKSKVGEKIIVLLEQLDDIDKSTIIGSLFKYTILKEITYDDFLRLSSIVQRAFLPDLNRLNLAHNLSKETEEHFVNLGIMTMKLEETTYSSDFSSNQIRREPIMSLRYELNSLGRKLKKYGFEKEQISR